jgi:hypothetical protein
MPPSLGKRPPRLCKIDIARSYLQTLEPMQDRTHTRLMMAADGRNKP